MASEPLPAESHGWAEPLESPELLPTISQVDVLVPPRLSQVLDIEEDCFPQCERLGPVLMQQHVTLRTSGLLIAEMSAGVCGYLLFTRTGGTGLITKLAVSAAVRRQGVASSLLRRGIQELERPTRRAGATEIQLHVDPQREGRAGCTSRSDSSASRSCPTTGAMLAMRSMRRVTKSSTTSRHTSRHAR